MANVVSSSFIAIMAGIPTSLHNSLQPDFSHSILAKIIDRRTYNDHTWVVDTGATDHIVCSMHLLTTIAAIT